MARTKQTARKSTEGKKAFATGLVFFELNDSSAKGHLRQPPHHTFRPAKVDKKGQIPMYHCNKCNKVAYVTKDEEKHESGRFGLGKMPSAHKRICRNIVKRAPAAAAPPEMANDPEANQIPSITKNKALNSTQSPKNLGLVDTQKRQKRQQNLRPVNFNVNVDRYKKRKFARRSSNIHSPPVKRPNNVDSKPNIDPSSEPEQTYSGENQEIQGTEDERAQQLLNSTTLWIGKLLFTTTEEKISELFSRAGPVRRVIMGLDREKKTPCGFCFVEYEKRIDAENVMRDKESYVLDGQKLVIGWDVGFTEGRQWGRGRHGGQEIDSQIPRVPSAEPTTIVKTEIVDDPPTNQLNRLSLEDSKSNINPSSEPEQTHPSSPTTREAERRLQLRDVTEEFVEDSMEEALSSTDPTNVDSEPDIDASSEQVQIHSGENQVIQPKPRRRVAQLFEPQSEHNADSSSRSSRSHSTKSSDTLERGFRDSDRHMNWPAACKECTKEQKKCKYHEEMDRPRPNISVDTSQTSDSSGCEFCKECSNGQCYTHRDKAHFKEVLPPTPQFEFSRADQVDTDTE